VHHDLLVGDLCCCLVIYPNGDRVPDRARRPHQDCGRFMTCLDSAEEIERGLAGGSVLADRTRRAVLAATAVGLPLLAVSGCKGVGALATPPRPAPDVAVLRSAIAAEEVMIARYDAVIRRSARLARGLRPLRDEHLLHLAQLRSRLIVPLGRANAASASPSVSGRTLHEHEAAGQGSAGHGSAGHGEAGPGAVPAGAAAISFLQAAERAAAADLLRKLAVASPSLAQLMASVAASETTHVAALSAARGAGRL